MDPILNPYAPGAGTQPPELAGRGELIHRASIALQRIASGKFGRSFIMTGLRGVGKTVLLNRIRLNAEAAGLITIRLEAAEDRSLPSLLTPGLKAAILKLDKGKATAELALRGLKALASFVRAMKIKYSDIEVGLDLETSGEINVASNLDDSLYELFNVVGQAAKTKSTAIVLFIDELQAVPEDQLTQLIRALHLASQDMLPIALVAAGLPQLPAKMGTARTYAERLFEFPYIGKLESTAASEALTIPAEKLGVRYTKEALTEILKQTQGYAYFLQEWGNAAWNIASAEKSEINLSDAKRASIHALADLDASFFRVRFDQLTPAQKNYLRAMAESKTNIIASGKIATILNKKVTEIAPIRNKLINKGIIYSPAHGETAFTVPLFGGFMKRMIPKLNLD
jgi:hypothetical protein